MTYQYTVRDNKNEVAFLMELQDLINNDDYKILKTKEHYCNVDYEHFYKDKRIGFIELKCRYTSLTR